ncbi:hypothetical protein Tco_1053316 [Tanacetum coccineum]
MYHDLYLGGKALVERENVGFDLTKSDLYPSFVEDLTAKGVGLHVADSPLVTITKMFYAIRNYSKAIKHNLGEDPIRARRGGLRAGEESKIVSSSIFTMSSKDSIAIQTCELSEEEFNDFLALYPIPSEYGVMLPKSNQTIFDAPNRYVRLYTHSFSLSNLKLPLTKFFCEVL